MAARRVVTVILDAIPTGFVAGLRTAAVSAKEFGQGLDTLAVKHSSAFNKITKTMGVVGGVLVGAFALAERSAMAFDKQMSAVGSVAGATAGQLGQLRAAALQAGKDTAFTATQAAQAEEELAKAGLSAAEILGGALHGTLVLAAAGDLDLAQAATIAAQAMTEFNLHGADVGKIADVLVAGANASVTSVSALGESLNQVGSMANFVHFSLADTVGVLADFAQEGLVGEEAGTALKTMLIKLQGPSGVAADLMRKLGINVYDSNGRFIGAVALAGQLQKGLGGLSEEQRNAALATIFGTRAVRGAIDLYKAGPAGIQGWIDKVNQSGAAADAAGKRQDNLAGDVHKLIGSLQALAISGTSQATGGLRTLTHAAEGTANALAGMPPILQSAIGDVAAFGGAGLLAAAGLLKARGVALNFNDALRETGPLGAKAATGLGRLGSALGKAGLAAGLTVGLLEFLHYLDHRGAPVSRNIDELTSSLSRFAATGQVSGEFATMFGKDLSKLGTEAKTVTRYAGQLGAAIAQYKKDATAGVSGSILQVDIAKIQGLTKAMGQGQTDIVSFDKSLSDLVATGQSLAAKQIFDVITQQLEAQGLTLAQIIALFPQYQQAAGDAATQSSGVAKGFATASESAKLMAGSLDDAIHSLKSLDDVFKTLNGGQISLREAKIAVEQDVADLTTALGKLSTRAIRTGKAFDITTQSGRDLSKIIDQGVQDAEKAAQAMLDQSGSVDKANGTWTTYIGKLRDTLHAAGASDAEIKILIGSISKMPPLVSTTFSTPGIDTALGKVSALKTYFDHLNGRRVTTYVQTNTSGVSTYAKHPLYGVNRWGGAYEHAAMGTLREAHVAPPVARGARYAYAEPQTRGEAFVPRAGNYGRSMRILSAAAGWYNASVVPHGGTINLRVVAEPGAAAAHWRYLRLEVQNHGGADKAFR